MLSPVIMVGCGGSGIKSVRYVREAIKAKLAANGWHGPLPQAWQFIGLDSLTGQTDLAEVPALPVRDYRQINGGFAKLRDLYSNLRAAHPPAGRNSGYREMLGWLPSSDELNGDPRIGMGQLRGVGRAFGVYSLNSAAVKDRLEAAHIACAGGSGELLEVCRALKIPVDAAAAVPPPLVVVVGSSAGGTGAGIMLDTIDMLKRISTNHVTPVAIVYGPEIFGQVMEPEMVANSLAFMSEMFNAFWSTGAGPVGLFPAPGVNLDSRGPFAIFSVGRENLSGADLNNSTTIYRAVGDTLASWITSPRLSTTVRDYVMGNRDANIQLGGYGFGEGQLFGAVTSFGSATVAVGRTRFRSYAKSFLMRNLYDFHWAGARDIARRVLSAADASKPDNVINELLASHFFPAYLEEAGLKQIFDKGMATSGITDLVLGQKHSEASGREFERLLWDRLPASEHNAAGWREHVSNFGKLLHPDQLAKVNGEFEERLNLWVGQLATRVLLRTNLLIAQASLPVAIKVVDKAISELQQYSNQFRQAAETARGRTATAQAEMWRKVSEITGSPRKEAAGVKDACQFAGMNLAQEARMEGMFRLERVIGEIERNLLAQIRSAMQMALEGDLTSANTIIDNQPAIVNQWPHGREVPAPFKPTMVEFLLEDWDEWPDILREIMRVAVDRTRDETDDMEAFRRQITMGDRDNPSGRPPMLWQEDNRVSDWAPHQPFRARLRLDVNTVDEVVAHWMGTSTPMSRHLSEGLSGYLADEGQVARMNKFRQQFRLALQQSKPLIKLDQVRLQEENARVGNPPAPMGVMPVIDQLPFNSGHAARDIAEELLRAELHIGPGVNMDQYFTNSEKESAVMSSFLDKSVHPSFVQNFTVTLANAMNGVQNRPIALRNWMKYKRGRTLDEFVPLPRVLLEAVVRGFVVARLVGQVTTDTSKPIQIASGDEVHEFPFPLLSPVDSSNVLAGILESMSLTFGKFPAEGMNAYAAYKSLYWHGVPELAADRSHQFRVAGSLLQFLQTGKVAGKVLDAARVAEFDAPTFEERKSKMLQYLEEYVAFLEELRDTPLTGWEMKSHDGTITPTDTPTVEFIDLMIDQYRCVRDAVAVAGDTPVPSTRPRPSA
jgi:hypothetical protein